MRPFLLTSLALLFILGALVFLASFGCENDAHVAVPVYEASVPDVTATSDTGMPDATETDAPPDAAADAVVDAPPDAGDAAQADAALDGGDAG
jgi:hypothetical protein